MHPTSSLLSSIFIPEEFGTSIASSEDGSLVKDTDYALEHDINGALSIIKLNKIPYIDLSKYDHQRKQWYTHDQYGNLWRKYDPFEWLIEEGKVYTLPGLYVPIQGEDLSRYYSVYGLNGGDYYTTQTSSEVGLWFSDYNPISIKVNDVSLTDITDYSGGRNIIPKLDTINTTDNKEFYFDKNGIIYTNQDFAEYDESDIVLSFYVTIDTINVKCRMSTNTTGLCPYTPVVDFYVVKMTGENL